MNDCPKFLKKYNYSIEASDPRGHPQAWTEPFFADNEKDAITTAKEYQKKHPTVSVGVVKVIEIT